MFPALPQNLCFRSEECLGLNPHPVRLHPAPTALGMSPVAPCPGATPLSFFLSG